MPKISSPFGVCYDPIHHFHHPFIPELDNESDIDEEMTAVSEPVFDQMGVSKDLGDTLVDYLVRKVINPDQETKAKILKLVKQELLRRGESIVPQQNVILRIDHVRVVKSESPEGKCRLKMTKSPSAQSLSGKLSPKLTYEIYHDAFAYAISYKSLSDLKSLMAKHKTNLDSLDLSGLSPLHYAAQRGSRKFLRLLLKSGASVNNKDFLMRTALAIAIIYDRTQAALYLLKKGAKVKTHDNNGCTPLHLAAAKNNAIVAKKLLSLGANNVDSHFGASPFLIAQTSGHQEVANLIFEHFFGTKE